MRILWKLDLNLVMGLPSGRRKDDMNTRVTVYSKLVVFFIIYLER
jgi:hypothetical protein